MARVEPIGTADLGVGDVVIACVAENRPDWYRMVELLAVSTRNFGGRLAAARIVAYFVEGIDPTLTGSLLELGVELRQVERYSEAHPPTNKLRMFQDFAARQDARCMVALDCDLVVVADFLDQIVPGRVMASPAGVSPMSIPRWHAFLAERQLAPAAAPTVTVRGQAVPAPYVNSGVVVVPVEHAAALASAWAGYCDIFIAEMAAGAKRPRTGYFLDQIALACALLDQSIPMAELNPDISPHLKGKLPETVEQMGFIHYHRHLDDTGLLGKTDSAVVNRIVDRVNRVVAARLPREAPAVGAEVQ